jgi:Zn finger protein HypA/HybF involved in hydrogenase expression
MGRISLKSFGNFLRAQKGAVIVAVVGVALFIVAGGLWEWAESNEFCGQLCHVNFSSYQAIGETPHGRVECVECHLGGEVLAEEFVRKANYISHPFTYLLRRYERPVFAADMRPAEEICGRCHWPLAFHDDTLREVKRFAEDEDNSERTTYLIMHTGGGSAEEGRGGGIHWHVDNEVWYLPTDALRQDIPWVRVIDQDGSITDYLDATVDADVELLAEEDLRLMDCMDCHNRTAHPFPSPQKAIDEALALGRISADIPLIKAKGVETLSGSYESTEEAFEEIAKLEDFYRSSYPDYYNIHQEEILSTVKVLQDIFATSNFPDLKVTWETHPDNIGHDEFPGCFRCHDGKHFSEDGESIRLHCNLCHSIPATVGPDGRVPEFPVEAVSEPPSHRATDWMDRHRFEANVGCEDCHGPYVFGSDDSNFCSNSSCHGHKWEWLGLDAAFEHPFELLGHHADVACNLCHFQATKPETECSACHEQHPHDWVAWDCELCHSPLGWIDSAADAIGAPVPHALEGRDDCLACHGFGLRLAFPDDHEGRPVAICEACHPPE